MNGKSNGGNRRARNQGESYEDEDEYDDENNEWCSEEDDLAARRAAAEEVHHTDVRPATPFPFFSHLPFACARHRTPRLVYLTRVRLVNFGPCGTLDSLAKPANEAYLSARDGSASFLSDQKTRLV